MQQTPQMLLVAVLVLALSTTVAALSDELPSLAIEFSSGKKQQATLDPKTGQDRLWLRFGSPSTFVRRGFDWQTIVAARDGERQLTQHDLIQSATAARQSTAFPSNKIVVAGSEAPVTTSPSVSPRRIESRKTSRVATISGDATFGNWDADVATDGLVVQVRPFDVDGMPVAVRGVLTVELFSMHRVDQAWIAHGRGRDFQLVGQWVVQVNCEPDALGSGWVRLPFQSAQPELDRDWAPYGLIHFQFAAAGHGVFHHSIDGVRIRPYAPLRDALQQNQGTRYFPSESR